MISFESFQNKVTNNKDGEITSAKGDTWLEGTGTTRILSDHHFIFKYSRSPRKEIWETFFQESDMTFRGKLALKYTFSSFLEIEAPKFILIYSNIFKILPTLSISKLLLRFEISFDLEIFKFEQRTLSVWQLLWCRYLSDFYWEKSPTFATDISKYLGSIL